MPCWTNYVKFRIDERQVLDMPCPASPQCRQVSRDEVAAAVPAADLARFDNFVAAERAERDPRTRWCTRPGCGTVCLPPVAERPFSRIKLLASLLCCCK